MKEEIIRRLLRIITDNSSLTDDDAIELAEVLFDTFFSVFE